jgi:hypothetical protein
MKSSKTVTSQLAEAGVPLDEEGRALGYSVTGTRAAGIHEWLLKREDPRRDPEFRRLVWRLRAKRDWATKSPERKSAIRAYRKQWYEDNKERCFELAAKWKRERRKDPTYREAENATKRAKRAVETEQRRRSIVYTCEQCGAQWSNFKGRIPSRPPKYCSSSCRARANYERGKAAGKRWAKRDKASRRDR